MGGGARDGLDFDRWSELARRDPERFEALRREAIEAVIRRAPADRQLRLRRLQWRVDAVRRVSASPLAAAVRISHMMWESVAELHEALTTAPAATARRSRHRPRILPFPRAH